MIQLECGDNMKKILKLFLGIILVIYAGIAIVLTVLLLNYNDYGITEFSDSSIILVQDDELKPNFNKDDLVVVNKDEFKDIKIGDKIFFYDTYKDQITINLGNVIDKEVINKDEVTFVIDGDHSLSSEYVIGKAENSKVYSGLGKIVSILESRYGFLFIIIFPILVLFIYEINMFIKELKHSDDE